MTAGGRSDAAYQGVRAIARFGQFPAVSKVPVQGLGQVDRDLLERYLAVLQHELAGKADHAKYVGSLNAFFAAIRCHGWDDTLPATAAFYPEDYPKAGPQRLPRAVAEHVMAQVEDLANLALWDHPAYRLVTLILIRCGLRITDAIRLPFDCLVSDSNGAPYLRYLNHKMNREALVPVDEHLVQQIRDQQARMTGRYPGGAAVLFPQAQANRDGRKAMHGGAYRRALYSWLARCDIRDEHGNSVHITPHQWRHTLGTVLQPGRPAARRAENPRLAPDDRAVCQYGCRIRPSAGTGRKPARSTPPGSPSRSARTARSATPPGPSSSCHGPPRRSPNGSASCRS